MLDLEALEAKAKAAKTPMSSGFAGMLSDAAIEFIAAANPGSILELISDLRDARAAVAAEREACAKVCDEISSDYCTRELRRFAELRTDAEIGAGECAAEIRARGAEGE